MKDFIEGRTVWEGEDPARVDAIRIIADTHEPGSLETLLWAFGSNDTVFSTGDHIPSGMHSPDRKLADKLKAEGVTDLQKELMKRYEEDPEYRAAVDAHYQKTIANLAIRKYALEKADDIHIVTCAGNQDFMIGRKLKKYGYKGNIFEDFEFNDRKEARADGLNTKYWGLHFEFKPASYTVDDTGVLLVPYDEELSKDKRQSEEIIKAGIAVDKEIIEDLSKSKSIVLLSHQSIDPIGMGIAPETVNAYTDAGNMALIRAYYEFARDAVGPHNVQLVHGHHHAPYQKYEFRGSQVHNLNIGDLLLVDPQNFKARVMHVVPY